MRLLIAAGIWAFLSVPAQAQISPLRPCEPSVACSIQSVVSVLPQWPKNIRRTEEPEGSGVVVHDGSLIATSDHVLGPATKVQVRTADGQVDRAEIVFRDPKTDIALLKINGKLQRLDNAVSKKRGLPRPADKACAIGNAFGLGLSLTCGVISAINVTGTGFNQIEDFVQTDAAVNPGMSGGALVDEHGRLVGMLSAIFTKKSDSNIGVNFAVSRVLLQSVIRDYLDNGRLDRPTSGILIRPAGDRSGGEIVRVAQGSVESRAGLQVGDVITRISGRRFSRPGLYRRALAFAHDRPPLRISVKRGDDEIQVELLFKKQENQ